MYAGPGPHRIHFFSVLFLGLATDAQLQSASPQRSSDSCTALCKIGVEKKYEHCLVSLFTDANNLVTLSKVRRDLGEHSSPSAWF
jgi:hypothetical protein